MSTDSTITLQLELERAMKHAQQTLDQLEGIKQQPLSLFRRGEQAQAFNSVQDEYEECKQQIYALKQRLYRLPDGRPAAEDAYRHFLLWKESYRRSGGWNGVCTDNDSDWLY